MKSYIKNILKEIIIAVLIAMAIMVFIKPTIVKEASMEPTLYENNYVILSRQSYRFGEPHRGDIIVFHTGLKQTNGKEKMLIKRIIGLPGDVISIVDGQVFINNQPYEENYLKDGYTDGYISDLKVPDGHLFVMGDNRLVSVDSRLERVGFVPIDQILGKAKVRLFPFNKITIF